MAYHTGIYLFLFLPAALLAYQLTPQAKRWITLLLADYLFFWLISGRLVVYLIGATAFTYGAGMWMEKLKLRGKQESIGADDGAAVIKTYRRKEKSVLITGIFFLLLILAVLKYYNFFARNLNGLFALAGDFEGIPLKSFILPTGISFYTLEAVGYLADVYWGKITAERHPGKLALFLSFFPQLMEGPISMYSQTADALWEGKPLSSENLSKGSVRILWGLFKKMIIADRLYILVNEIFGNYRDYSGVIVAAAAVAYTVQLYMEFSGCMDICIGSGRMFGVTLPENFCQPFASKNAAEFWRRWHITLGAWFKAYVFYPVSVSGLAKKWSRFGKKHLGKYLTRLGISAIALFPVWLCNGLWHGPRWSYVFYGMYYFVILLGDIALEPVRDRIVKVCHVDDQALYWKIPQTLKTWCIIFVGELFFRADGLRAGIAMFFSMFRDFHLKYLADGTFLGFGLDAADYLAIGVGCVTVAIVGVVKEHRLLGKEGIGTLSTPIRWALYYCLIFAVIIFGAYGAGYQKVDLIYAGF